MSKPKKNKLKNGTKKPVRTVQTESTEIITNLKDYLDKAETLQSSEGVDVNIILDASKMKRSGRGPQF